jgi:hypothetical protein
MRPQGGHGARGMVDGASCSYGMDVLRQQGCGSMGLTGPPCVLQGHLPDPERPRGAWLRQEDDPFAVELGGGLLIDHTVRR